jgi:hypothetical protein
LKKKRNCQAVFVLSFKSKKCLTSLSVAVTSAVAGSEALLAVDHLNDADASASGAAMNTAGSAMAMNGSAVTEASNASADAVAAKQTRMLPPQSMMCTSSTKSIRRLRPADKTSMVQAVVDVDVAQLLANGAGASLWVLWPTVQTGVGLSC